jgi:hypothetical protein
MVDYGNSIMENPLAAKEMKKAANRLSQAATEILKRHEEIKTSLLQLQQCTQRGMRHF